MTTIYTMRGLHTPTSKHVYWTSIGAADMDGTFSGYDPSDLTGIVVDYITAQNLTPITNENPQFEVSGDLDGLLPSPTVIGLQGNPIEDILPEDGYVLTWDDGYWKPLPGGGGTPGGSDTQVQFNDSGVFGGDAGFVYNKTTNILTLSDGLAFGTNPATTGTIRLTDDSNIVGRNSLNTANHDILVWNDGALTIGNATASSTSIIGNIGVGIRGDSITFSNTANTEDFARFTADGIQLGSATMDLGGGNGVIGIDNATTNPSTNPTSGIVAYVDASDGYLKYRRGDGAVVSLNGAGGSAGVCTPEQFGAVGDGVTDDTTAMHNALNAVKAGTYGTLLLGADRTYLMNPYTWDGGSGNGGTVMGQGHNSVIKCQGATAGLTALFYVKNVDAFTLKNLTLTGDDSSSQRGILLGTAASDAPQKTTLENVLIKDFALSGIHSTNAPVATSQVCQMVNCRVDNCGTGIVGGAQMVLDGVNTSNCTLAWQFSAGNLTAVGCVTSENTTGLQLQASGNDGHGTVTGCTFNHNTTSLEIQDIANGMTFSGCHFYACNLSFDNVGIVDFTGCSLRPINLTFTDPAKVRFVDCRIETSTLGTVSIADTCSVEFLNCRDLNGTVPQFIRDRVQLSFTFASDADDTLTAQESVAETIIIASGTITATRNLTSALAPAGAKSKKVLIINNNAQSVTYKWSSGTGITVTSGSKTLIGSDGTNAIELVNTSPALFANAIQALLATTTGLQIGSGSTDHGGGSGVIGIDNASTNPTTNPTNGIVVYVDAGDGYLKYRKADGTTVNLNGAGGAGTPSGWNTVYDIDFTAQGNQSITDGSNNIDGKNWTAANASAASTFDILNGTGLRIFNNTTNSDYNASTRTAPILSIAATSLYSDYDPHQHKIRFWVYFTHNVDQAFETARCGFEMTSTPTVQNFQHGAQHNGGATIWFNTSTVNSGSTGLSDPNNTTHDVAVTEFADWADFTSYSGSYGASWPATTQLRLRNKASHTNINSGIKTPGDLSVFMCSSTANTSGNMQMIIKRIKIEILVS